MLGERLLAVEWQRRDLPEADAADAGTWLLISISDATDPLATELTDALKLHGAECKTMLWPQHVDHMVIADRLRSQLDDGGYACVVVLAGAGNLFMQRSIRGSE